MIKIRCVVERITYQNPENGYFVLKVHIKGYDGLAPVVGNLLDANVGSVIVAEGDWKVDTKYGRQFMAEKWEETLPAVGAGNVLRDIIDSGVFPVMRLTRIFRQAQTRLVMGIHPYHFSFHLDKGDVFETPEVIMAYSDEGLGNLPRIYHDAYCSNLILDNCI